MVAAQPDDKLISQLFDKLPDAVIWYMPLLSGEGQLLDFEVYYVNEAVLQLAPGFRPGTRILETSVADDRARRHIFERCRAVWESGETAEDTYHNNVLERYYNVQRSKILNGVLSISRDRTAEMLAGIEHQRQSRLLQSIIENMPSGFSYYEAVRDETGRAVDLKPRLINRKAADITGFSLEELYNETAYELLQKRNNLATLQQSLQVVETGEPLYIEFFSPTLQRWLAYSVVRFEEGIMSNYVDITETKVQSERVEAILNSSLNGMMALEAVRDAAGRVVDFTFLEVNEAFTRILGLPKAEVVGRRYLAVFPDSVRHGVFDLHLQALAGGRALEEEFYYDVEGYYRWFRISIAPMGPGRLVQTFWDVSENHRQRQQLEAAVEELKRSNERLSEFTHVASHDLKEPLRKVILYTNLLEDRHGAELPFEARDYLQRVQQTTYRMQSLINDLLSYAQVSRRPDRFEAVDLDVLLRDVVADLEMQVYSSGGRVLCAGLPAVEGDPLQLRQLFQNLVSNALKFHRAGLVPDVAVEGRTLPAAGLPAPWAAQAVARHYVAVSVRDNGIGFLPGQEQKIFQLFQRLHSRSEFDGTGIGLAIVQKVVENHHGFIDAHSVPDEGSVFTVYLPLS